METTRLLLIGCILGLAFAGAVVMSWGDRLPRRGHWLIGLGLLALIGTLVYGLESLSEQAFKPALWARGWIWSRDEVFAVRVGVIQDSLGLVISALMAVISLLVLLDRALSLAPRAERLYAGFGIAAAGVALSWVSLTPWLAFAGLAITLFAGFVALGTRWDTDHEAMIATRFGWERSWGLLLAILGAAILANSGAPLGWGSGETWSSAGPALGSMVFGAILLVSGLFVQFQPFPFLGWLSLPAETPVTARVLLGQVFPAWGAFAVLIRLEPQLRAIGIFPDFGWFAVISAVLAFLSGLIQGEWKRSLGAWLSGALSVSLAVLAFCGPFAGLTALVAVSLGGAALAAAGSGLSLSPASAESAKKRAPWSRFASFVAAALGTGLVGSVGAVGILRWLAQGLEAGWVTAAFGLVFLFMVLLGWKLPWSVSKLHPSSESNWASVALPFLLSILGLAVVWTGKLTDLPLSGSADQLFSSLSALIFGSEGSWAGDAAATALWVYAGILVLGVLLAYWGSGRREDQWARFESAFPRASRFIVSGYFVDRGFSGILRGLVWAGESVEWAVDKKVWDEWLPSGLAASVKWAGSAFGRVDELLSGWIETTLRWSVEAPAKALQRVQTGDVRLYLFLGVGSGLVMLLYFLKF